MKKQKLKLVEFGHVLGRSEMKKIMAGSGQNSCSSSAPPECSSHEPCEECDEWGLCSCSSCCLA